MQDKLQATENTPAVTERRACPRLRVTSLMYIDIGNLNGGIVTSLSESGLALTAATALGNGELGDSPLRMRIQFPGIPDAIEASGQIAWRSSSGKEAGVRFVELEEKTREQIRNWISAQACAEALRREPPSLPKLRLPGSRGRKPRGARFSFSYVASSRVDAQDETPVEDFPGGVSGKLPPLQAGEVGFCDGAEAVASAFESPALTETQAEKSRAPKNKPEALQRHPSTTIAERRQHSRRPILLFTYAVLGEDNGGLVFNLGEGGLALTAAAPLQEHHLKKIRLRFPDSEDWIETGGRLAWKNDSGREVGIEFSGLPEDARLRVREWAMQEEPSSDLGSKEDDTRTTQGRAQELPSFMEPDGSSLEASETAAFLEEQPFKNQAFEEHLFVDGARTPDASSSALFKPGIKGIVKRASVRKRVAKIKPPRLPAPSENTRGGGGRKAFSIAAGVGLAVGGWMFFQRTSRNEASGIIAQTVHNPQSSQEAPQKPEVSTTTAGPAGPAKEPPIQPSKGAATQTDTAKLSFPQIETEPPGTGTRKTAANAGANPARASKENPTREQVVANVPPSNLPHKPVQPQQILPARREQETRAPQFTAPAPPPDNKLAGDKPVETKSAETKPAESKPLQVAQALPTLNTGKDANGPPPSLSANAPQPAGSPPVDLEKEKPSVAPKQPEAPVDRTPVVGVSFDPYPSIRMPKTEKSKKSQGKNLQMGRLLSRVDPIYPEEARQQGIEGTVRLHAIFNREGAVQSVISVSGPPLLVPAAINAVRQWRYSQTILGGQAMETEEDVTVLFRLANSASKN